MSKEFVGENDLHQVHEEVDADLKRVEVTEARDQAKEKTEAREEALLESKATTTPSPPKKDN